jgi:hypothetical protein
MGQNHSVVNMQPSFCDPAIVVIAIVSVLGCSRSELSPRAVVTGVVTLNGEPLHFGRVQFEPDRSKGNNGPVATGIIDETGRYRLSTDRRKDDYDGAVVGFHKVCVEAIPQPTDPTDIPRSLIPDRYNNPATSGLTAEIKAVELNEIPFELKSD